MYSSSCLLETPTDQFTSIADNGLLKAYLIKIIIISQSVAESAKITDPLKRRIYVHEYLWSWERFPSRIWSSSYSIKLPRLSFRSCKLMMLYGPHVRDLLRARLKQLKINLSFNFLHPLLLLLFLPKKSPSISLPLDENAVEGKESQFKIERPDCPSFPSLYSL